MDQKNFSSQIQILVAYLVFAKPESLKGVMKADKKNSTFYAQSVEQPIITGLELFCAEYNQSFPDVKKLQDRILNLKKNCSVESFGRD